MAASEGGDKILDRNFLFIKFLMSVCGESPKDEKGIRKEIH